MEHQAGIASRIWSGVLSLADVSYEHQWTSQEYLALREEYGWHVTFSKEMAARITLMYAECGREEDKA